MVFGVTNQKMVFVYDLLVNESVEVFSAEHEAICRSLAWSQAESERQVIPFKIQLNSNKNFITELEQITWQSRIQQVT